MVHPSIEADRQVDRGEWRLLPSEEVLWQGQPVASVLSDLRWTLGPLFLLALSLIFGSFAGLLLVSGLDGSLRFAAFSLLLFALGGLTRLAPRYLHDPCEALVTDRRVLWKRGPFRRSMDRSAVNYARIRWHRGHPGVGHLELVRAVPFGPLARSQRLVLTNFRSPDAIWAIIRGVEPAASAGAGDVPLVDRLDPGERVLWGGHPEGWHFGWREVGIALIGAAILATAVRYAANVGGVLLLLEEQGLAVTSWTWVFFFSAMLFTFALLVSTGGGLVWFGLWRSRALGRDSEYVVTNRRLLIRRGLVELSVDRRCIVDVAAAPVGRGLSHAFLVLDAPGSRALSDSGALASVLPPRDRVAPILYEVRNVDELRAVVLDVQGCPFRDAA